MAGPSQVIAGQNPDSGQEYPKMLYRQHEAGTPIGGKRYEMFVANAADEEVAMSADGWAASTGSTPAPVIPAVVAAQMEDKDRMIADLMAQLAEATAGDERPRRGRPPKPADNVLASESGIM